MSDKLGAKPKTSKKEKSERQQAMDGKLIQADVMRSLQNPGKRVVCKNCGLTQMGLDFNTCMKCGGKMGEASEADRAEMISFYANIFGDLHKPKPRAANVEDKRKKKKRKPKVKPQNAESMVKKAQSTEPSGPMKLGDDKEWAKMQKILDELKAKSDEMAAESEGEETMDKCGFCFKEDFDMMRCGRCGVYTYCSEKCARQNLRNHDKECREARNDSDWNRALREVRSRIGPVVLREPEAEACATTARPMVSRVAPKQKKKLAQKFSGD